MQIPQAAAVRQPELGVELEQGLEDEDALGQARVRDLEARLGDCLVPVEKKVEVDTPRAPALLLRSVTAESALDLQKPLEQLAGWKLGLELCRCIYEARLVENTDRIGLPEGRNGDDLDPVRPPKRLQG